MRAFVARRMDVGSWHNPDVRLATPEGRLPGAFRTLAMGHILRDLVDVAEGLDLHALLTPSPNEGLC